MFEFKIITTCYLLFQESGKTLQILAQVLASSFSSKHIKSREKLNKSLKNGAKT
jgi:hypothetical protein